MAWKRTSRHDRGYGTAWDKLRDYVMRRDFGLCQVCLAKGKAIPGREVDHIIPKAKGGTDDEDNLRCICHECHVKATNTEMGRRTKPRIGPDGWPVG